MKHVRIYDNGGKTIDRYTVIYMDMPEKNGLYSGRGMSAKPYHPQGFGVYCMAMPGRHLGRRITFEQLPRDCQQVILSDLNGD